ncbi:MAG: NTP transferase domain-containing protein [Parvularculaceae bacterium]
MTGPVVGALLAAGASRRFGEADKLLVPFRGEPLLAGPARALGAFERRIAITPADAPARAAALRRRGLETIENTRADEGLGASLALAAATALRGEAVAMVVCLADQPFVDGALMGRLIGALGDADAVVCLADGVAGPPAAFSARALGVLSRLEGDVGARKIIDGFENVVRMPAPSWRVRDVDTPEDLAALA